MALGELKVKLRQRKRTDIAARHAFVSLDQSALTHHAIAAYERMTYIVRTGLI